METLRWKLRTIWGHDGLSLAADVDNPMAKKQKFPHLLGSKWTALRKIEGWRHFEVVNRKNQGSLVFAELKASCDPKVRLWVNAKLLKNRDLWQAGWQPLEMFSHLEEMGR